ncbi:hypothetical protein FCG41_18470 [Azotobacter chroococcum]|nr:hypothetical protein [Azotobacter chroococcum]TKD35012.1 hypothetical protein FCG41_18470 [Azotobacter chroococcum]
MARDKVREAKRLVASGADPVQHKIAQREAREARQRHAAAAEYWFSARHKTDAPPAPCA